MVLRDYQKADLQFFSNRKHVANFSEQRTGKTPVAVRWLNNLAPCTAVIITTGSALFQWAEECIRWGELIPYVVYGTRTKKQKIVNAWRNSPELNKALIISHDTLKMSRKSSGFIDDIVAQKPKAVILDEAHKIKHITSSVSKTIMRLCHTEYKMAITAPPANNKQHEIWAILHWLFPTLYMSYWKFVGEYF